MNNTFHIVTLSSQSDDGIFHWWFIMHSAYVCFQPHVYKCRLQKSKELSITAGLKHINTPKLYHIFFLQLRNFNVTSSACKFRKFDNTDKSTNNKEMMMWFSSLIQSFILSMYRNIEQLLLMSKQENFLQFMLGDGKF